MLVRVEFPLFTLELRPELADQAADSNMLRTLIDIVESNMPSRSHKLPVHEIVELNTQQRVVTVNEEEVQFIVTKAACDSLIGSQGVGVSRYD